MLPSSMLTTEDMVGLAAEETLVHRRATWITTITSSLL